MAIKNDTTIKNSHLISVANNFRLGYRGDIEGLRAVAILLVIADHAGVPWLTGGFVGVDVFFVLSGYLITGLLLQEIRETGGLRLWKFYVRRLRRLLPALLFMVTCTFPHTFPKHLVKLYSTQIMTDKMFQKKADKNDGDNHTSNSA